MTEIAPGVRHPVISQGSAGSDQHCPACGHEGGAERITRGQHLWPFNKPRVVRCCHVTVEQDALVDDVVMCNCDDVWHTLRGVD